MAGSFYEWTKERGIPYSAETVKQHRKTFLEENRKAREESGVPYDAAGASDRLKAIGNKALDIGKRYTEQRSDALSKLGAGTPYKHSIHDGK